MKVLFTECGYILPDIKLSALRIIVPPFYKNFIIGLRMADLPIYLRHVIIYVSLFYP